MRATQPPTGYRKDLIEWLFLLAMLLAFGAYIGHTEYHDYLELESQQTARLQTQATVIEKNLVPQLLSTSRAIDGVLESIPAWRLEHEGFQKANQRLKLISDTLAGIRTLMVIDAQGQVLSSNREELVGQNFFQREYFQHALTKPRRETLYITPPFQTVLHSWVMSVYRIIPGPRGEFAGIVMASVDPSYFNILLDSVRDAPDMWAFVAHGDGKVFMMVPERADLTGKDLAQPGTFFSRHIQSGEASSLFSGQTFVTGEANRLIALRTIRPDHLNMEKPLVVGVSRDALAMRAGWARELQEQVSIYVVLVLATTVSLFVYQKRRRVFVRQSHTRERALRASDARLHSFFDATPDALLISDIAGVITMANQQVERLLGYTVEELIGKSIEELVPGRFRTSHPALRSEFSGNPSARRMGNGMAVKALCQDGSECDVEVSLSRIETDEGLYFASALRDITERNRSEEQLRIAAVAFESHQGVMVTDANSVILRVNQAFSEITGYRSEDVVGRKPNLLKSNRHDADFYRSMWEAIIRTGVWQGEIWDQRKNGDIYPKWLSISSVRDGQGAVTHYVGTHQDITDRKLAEDKINELAFFDQLTGLPNRTLLLDRLKQAATASSRNGNFGALLFIDLDDFKTLNDTLGHDTGDLLLKKVAQRLATCVRDGDTVARLSGDEFMVILEGLSSSEVEAATDAEAIAEKILGKLALPYQLGEVVHHSTASIGVTLFGNLSATMDDLMKQADLAMYRSKEAGRNALRFFDPAMATAVIKRVALEADLRNAVAAKQFVLHYQAQVTGLGRVTGAEVLVRWLHPERGMVAPADFIPLAEETGVILALGQWVLETACMQLAQWEKVAGMAHLTLAVNVSAHQFGQSGFVDEVLSTLQRSGANPMRLKLELTESLLVGSVQDIVEKMFALKAKGVGFSLDDFGTGYSSLSYLNRLPLDQLKIDQSFVRDVLINPSDAAIARTIIVLAKSLNLGVIAEGVETEAQRDFLASSGCHAYQGYFFSRPVPVDHFEAIALRV
jgi:diguanylate cyclase (GGDEF)-like protein/PAS domain S-box-containing protein